ncbi:MAG: YceI family protein [Acidobacteriota bacterium]
MKSLSLIFLLFGLFNASLLTSEPKPIRIDVNHSNIGFAVPIAGGLSKVRGKFSEFKMELNYDDKDITKSTVDVKITVKSIDTGINQRDEHLRTADFFDVEKYPEITFKSKRVIKNGKKLTLVGDFTMHGVTKEISFPFTITGRQFEEKEKLLTLGFLADLTINRRDFGINYQHQSVPNFIGDLVEIELSIITRANKIE